MMRTWPTLFTLTDLAMDLATPAMLPVAFPCTQIQSVFVSSVSGCRAPWPASSGQRTLSSYPCPCQYPLPVLGQVRVVRE